MIINFKIGGESYSSDISAGTSLAINTDFEGDQPNHFSADRASRRPYEIGSFVGRTQQGGSCNVDVISLVTHCNGTHTESVAHIVNDAVPVSEVAPRGLLTALLISVAAVPADETDDTYRPPLDGVDRVITAGAINDAVNSIGMNAGGSRTEVIEGLAVESMAISGSVRDDVDALIIRQLPNENNKKSAVYGENNQPVFLTCDAMDAIEQLGISHLLVDFPSVDRMYDDGLLTNHHIFWNVPETTHLLTEHSHTGRTISEMIFVPDGKTDGVYLLGIQCPAWNTDAAPSRPVIFDIAGTDSSP
ncbi:MAG: hypothetical protein AAF456_02360 [Planctomycetota bacterium]